ncbi:MAG: orotate phosphoribosyltransferase [bacterium]|nr:orotate phosphoribosyltransferase [bacterium]
MDLTEMKVSCSYNSALQIKVVAGHFATNHSHINYYLDLNTTKVRQKEAFAVARTMANEYVANTVIDTIVCMDGMEIIGAYLAEELTAAGIMSMNAHQSIYIITPEVNRNGQLIFRDNIKPMVKNKHILLLLASATTGITIAKSLECIEYYGGEIQGISAIFSAVSEIRDHTINSIFRAKDLYDYETYPQNDCPLCKRGIKLDAMINSYGYSELTNTKPSDH